MTRSEPTVLLLLLGALGGCGENPSDLVVCPDIGIPSIVAEVRDQNGIPSAIGATLNAMGKNASLAGHGFGDSLQIFTDDPFGVTGEFQVSVEKPWYHGSQLNRVKVPGGPCGVEEPFRVEFIIELQQGAPPVRQVVLPPSNVGLGDGNISTWISAFVEAEGGVSHELYWGSSDSAVVSVDQLGKITSHCLERPDSAWVVAWSVVDPGVRDSVKVWVSRLDPSSGRCM